MSQASRDDYEIRSADARDDSLLATAELIADINVKVEEVQRRLDTKRSQETCIQMTKSSLTLADVSRFETAFITDQISRRNVHTIRDARPRKIGPPSDVVQDV